MIVNFGNFYSIVLMCYFFINHISFAIKTPDYENASDEVYDDDYEDKNKNSSGSPAPSSISISSTEQSKITPVGNSSASGNSFILHTPRSELKTTKSQLNTTESDSQTTVSDSHTTVSDSHTTESDSQTEESDSQTEESDSQKTKSGSQKTKSDSQASESDSETSERDKDPNWQKNILSLKKMEEEKVVSNGEKTCFSCYRDLTNDMSEEENQNLACYRNLDSATEICGKSEFCFTELHPNYIKRGCTSGLPDQMFVCDCDFCNDKPANDSSYFTYPELSDMIYDNALINQNQAYHQLHCKSCESKKTNNIQGTICVEGTNAQQIVCEYDQVCFTQIKDKGKYVKRGCVTKPTYNAYFTYCDTSKCNKEQFKKPIISRNIIFPNKVSYNSTRLHGNASDHPTTDHPTTVIQTYVRTSGSTRLCGITFVTVLLSYNLMKNIKSVLFHQIE